jgi:lysozyme
LAKVKTTKKVKQQKSSILSKFFIFCATLFVGFLVFLFIKNQSTTFVTYKEFGIPIPINYTIHGIDVSHHNETIRWEAVQKMYVKGIKIQFSFIKATQSNNYIDPQFKRNWQQTKANNIIRGAYHYFTENASGEAQAQHFINTVGELLPGDLPPVLDIEENKYVSKQILNKEALDWLRIIEKHYGIKPIVYTYVSFYDEKLEPAIDAYPFWAAHYKEQKQPATNRSWQIWQHSEDATVSGINTKVDFNVFNGDYFKFKQLLVH